MLERPTVDLAEATSFLVARFGDRAVDLVEAPRQGAWSIAYFFAVEDEHKDEHFVLRFAPWRDNFETDRTIAEHSSADLPIPRVVEIGEACGHHYAVSERAVRLDLGGARRRHDAARVPLGAADARRAACGRRVVVCGLGPADTRRRRPVRRLAGAPVEGGRRSAGRHARVAGEPRHAPDAERAFDEAYAGFAALAPAMPELRHLVHSDLLYGNVLVADDRVSAVFDWGCAMYGDFLYDVAWLSFFAPWFPGLDAVDVRGSVLAHYDGLALAVPDFDARVRCYEAHVGLASQAYQALIGDWDELERTARRTAVVLDG